MNGGFGRVACAAALVLIVPTIPADAQLTSTLRIGARVAPLCTIAIDDTVGAGDGSPAVRVTCSRSGLNALRVSTNRGDNIQPIAISRSRRQAGGEILFVVPMVLATVAGNLPVFAPPPPSDRTPVTVTLDF